MVKFYFNKTQELKDIVWIFNEYDFFVKNKYHVYYPEFSKNLTKQLIEKPNVNSTQLLKEFTKIFERDLVTYRDTLMKVTKNWKNIENKFFIELDKILPKNILKNISCYISRYGPGGRHYFPDKISVRVRLENKKDMNNANLTIAHEIIHLCIDKQIRKNKISFENTEMIVDLICAKTSIRKLFENPDIQGFGNKRIEKIFFKNYFNVFKTINEIASLN